MLAILLATILTGLRAAVAVHVDRDRTRTPVLLLAWTRIGRAAARLAALFARWQSATLPLARPRPSRAGQARTRTARPYFPAGHAWLAAGTDHQVRSHASQLSHLLAQPEAAAFLAAVPQAGRILRPLCHMLGIAPPPALQHPPRPPRIRRQPVRPAPPPEQAAPDRPLPAYVRAAVRAWKPRYG